MADDRQNECCGQQGDLWLKTERRLNLGDQYFRHSFVRDCPWHHISFSHKTQHFTYSVRTLEKVVHVKDFFYLSPCAKVFMTFCISVDFHFFVTECH